MGTNNVVKFPFETVYQKRAGKGAGFDPSLNCCSDMELRELYEDCVSLIWEYEITNEYGLISAEEAANAKRLRRDILKSLISRNREFIIDEYSQLQIKPLK